MINIPADKISADLRQKLLSYWRRRRTFWTVAGIGITVVVLLALLLPPTYQASGTILIEQQEIPQDLVRSVITSFADQRVQIISQRVMTTQNLLSLVDRYDLYPEIRRKEPREVLLAKFREDIGMHMISADVIDPRSGRPTQATIAFAVSYSSRSPDLALKVANELTTLYLNENLTSRTRSTEQTSEFFQEEAARESAHTVELDKKLAAFKEQHHDELPELETLNIQTLDRTELDLHDAENHLAALDSQRVLLQAQLAQISPNTQVFSDTGQRVFGPEDRLKALKSQLASYKAKYAPGHPDIVSTQREVDGLEKEVQAEDQTAERVEQLDQARAQLAAAQQKYTPDHPDVIRLQHTVDSLAKEVDKEAASGTRREATNHADNPVYIQVKGQLDALEVERVTAVQKRDELKAKFEDYQRRMALTPEVEQEYRVLARDLESAQLKYQEILAKQTEAQVAENLETERKGERFTLIEPPQPPEKPISPNRFAILLVGIVLSLGAGFAAVMAHESLDASVRGPGDIRDLLQVPALASIPIILTAAEVTHQRRLRRYTLGGGIAAVVVAAVLVHVLVKPLDVLWVIVLRRFGA
jgi:uncharacterized protein involved in exopolysaccharide biosynthesis